MLVKVLYSPMDLVEKPLHGGFHQYVMLISYLVEQDNQRKQHLQKLELEDFMVSVEHQLVFLLLIYLVVSSRLMVLVLLPEHVTGLVQVLSSLADLVEKPLHGGSHQYVRLISYLVVSRQKGHPSILRILQQIFISSEKY